MRTPEQYAARAAAAWHPPPSPACVADIQAAVREALLDAATDLLRSAAVMNEAGLGGEASGFRMAAETVRLSAAQKEVSP